MKRPDSYHLRLAILILWIVLLFIGGTVACYVCIEEALK